MARRLVKVRQIIQDAEAEGLDPDQIFIDPDDLVELEQEQQGEE